MAVFYADRVKETSTTTGVGSYSLAGAVDGCRSFSVVAGKSITYCAEDGINWEIGEGVVTGSTISRASIIASSNSGAAVNWAAGEKSIFLTQSADRTVTTDKVNTFTEAIVGVAGTVTVPSFKVGNSGLYSSTPNQIDFSAGGIRSFAAEYVASSVNYVVSVPSVTTAATGIAARGTDANIPLLLNAKGTGAVLLNSTAFSVSSTGALSTSQLITGSLGATFSGGTVTIGAATTITSIGAFSTSRVITGTLGATFSGANVASTIGFSSSEYAAGTGAPGTINWANGQNQTRTFTSSGALTLSNPINGATYKLRIVQGGVGSFEISSYVGATILWAGGSAPILSSAAGSIDIISLYYNGTNYYGQIGVGFA